MNRNGNIAGLVALVFLLAAAAGASGSSRGESGASILNFAVGSRPLGMGEAAASVTGNLSGMHYNPALLGALGAPSASVFYRRGVADDNFGGVLGGYPRGRSVVAGSFVCYSVGDIRLVEAGGYARTVSGQRDFMLTLCYGYRFTPRLAGGINFKVLRSTLVDEFSATSFAFDLGVHHTFLEKRLAVAAAVQNLGKGMKYVEVEDPLPFVFRLGASYGIEIGGPLTLAVDLVKWRDSSLKLHLGAEYIIAGTVGIRAGYRAGYDPACFTLGLGFRVSPLEAGYASGSHEDLDYSHLLEVVYRPGQLD